MVGRGGEGGSTWAPPPRDKLWIRPYYYHYYYYHYHYYHYYYYLYHYHYCFWFLFTN